MLPPVEKALWAFSTKKLHDGCSAAAAMISVISDAHVLGNDDFHFISAVRGGNPAGLSLQALKAKAICI
jgi:hypothetical protein